jgi:hypothetical protein
LTTPSRRSGTQARWIPRPELLANSALEVIFFGVCPFGGLSVKGHDVLRGEF